MRKLIIEEWISLDGYVSDKNGKLDFFAGTVRDTYTGDRQVQFLNSIDCIVLSRKTYEQFVILWPGRPIENEPLADTMNTKQKIVFSNSLQDAPWGQWPKATIEKGDAVARIRQLKSLPGKNIVLWGSISLAQLVMEENLADEYHIHLCPAVTGGGKKFFTEAISPEALQLIETGSGSNGMVFLNYRPVKLK